MSTATVIDSKFMQLATPVLLEFGFSSVKELVAEQVSLMLQSRIDRYEAEDRLYASRFGQSYELIASRCKQNDSEDFEFDGALNDWRFAREAAALYRAKMLELQNA